MSVGLGGTTHGLTWSSFSPFPPSSAPFRYLVLNAFMLEEMVSPDCLAFLDRCLLAAEMAAWIRYQLKENPQTPKKEKNSNFS